jgi:hypothetical protein
LCWECLGKRLRPRLMRMLTLSGRRALPGRADGYPSGPPTDPYVRNSRIRFLKQSLCYPPQSTGVMVSGLVSSTSLPCVLPLDALLDVAFPPVGPLGLGSPPSSVLCDATTATCLFQGPSLVARSPIPCVLPLFVVSHAGSSPGGSPRTTPGPLVTRSPLPGMAQGDRWLSQVPEFPL